MPLCVFPMLLRPCRFNSVQPFVKPGPKPSSPGDLLRQVNERLRCFDLVAHIGKVALQALFVFLQLGIRKNAILFRLTKGQPLVLRIVLP
jgi:hypothetical protein